MRFLFDRVEQPQRVACFGCLVPPAVGRMAHREQGRFTPSLAILGKRILSTEKWRNTRHVGVVSSRSTSWAPAEVTNGWDGTIRELPERCLEQCHPLKPEPVRFVTETSVRASGDWTG